MRGGSETKALFRPGIIICPHWSDRCGKVLVPVHTWHYNASWMCLLWLLVMGSPFTALHANKHGCNFISQRPNHFFDIVFTRCDDTSKRERKSRVMMAGVNQCAAWLWNKISQIRTIWWWPLINQCVSTALLHTGHLLIWSDAAVHLHAGENGHSRPEGSDWHEGLHTRPGHPGDSQHPQPVWEEYWQHGGQPGAGKSLFWPNLWGAG